jgi:O-antigen/teichoic acid export membrane protein
VDRSFERTFLFLLLVVALSTGLLVAADRPWPVVAIGIPMLAMLCVLTVLLVPRYGSIGAAVASLVAATGAAIASLVLAQQRLRVGYPVRSALVGIALATAHR